MDGSLLDCYKLLLVNPRVRFQLQGKRCNRCDYIPLLPGTYLFQVDLIENRRLNNEEKRLIIDAFKLALGISGIGRGITRGFGKLALYNVKNDNLINITETLQQYLVELSLNNYLQIPNYYLPVAYREILLDNKCTLLVNNEQSCATDICFNYIQVSARDMFWSLPLLQSINYLVLRDILANIIINYYSIRASGSDDLKDLLYYLFWGLPRGRAKHYCIKIPRHCPKAKRDSRLLSGIWFVPAVYPEGSTIGAKLIILSFSIKCHIFKIDILNEENRCFQKASNITEAGLQLFNRTRRGNNYKINYVNIIDIYNNILTG
ncbi:MAG: hypothetical protein GXO43_08420 [Crenarchaeota archaeon]|nr:hypothetical protein [Thermoproteota archaeon]